MSTGESFWIERAQSAEAKIKTMEDQYRPALDRIKEFKAAFGVKEMSDGRITIDYEKFVTALGPEQCLELRGVIDEIHRIKGEPGEKPRIRLSA